MGGTLAIARSRLRRRWVGLIGLGLLAGIVGGMSTAAVAGERRTVTVAPRLIEATRAHDAIIGVSMTGGGAEAHKATTKKVQAAIDAQPGVEAVWDVALFMGRTSESKDWYSPIAGLERDSEIYQPILAAGRLADPAALDEVVITAQTAANTHLDVGSVIHMDFYAPDQFLAVMKGTEERPNGEQDVRLRVVGLLRDAFDISPAQSARFMLATPAFARRWGEILGRENGFAVKLQDGTRGVDRFVGNLRRELGPTAIRPQTNLAALERNASADRVARASILMLGAIIAILGMFALVQATRRHLTLDDSETRTLEAIGFTRRNRILAATVPGILAAAVAVGTVIAVAWLLSSIFPLGRPRRLEPTPGFELNAAIGWAGALLTAVVVIGAFAAAAAVRTSNRPPTRLPLGGGLRFLTASARPSVLLGTRLALEPSSGRGPVGTRGIVLGASVGVVGAVAAVTFLGSFHGLMSSSQNWGADYHLSMDAPSDQLARDTADTVNPQEGITHRSRAIAADPDVDAVAIQSAADIDVAGLSVPASALRSVTGRVRPVVRSGRAPVADDEIALGPGLARRLGVEPGDRVRVGPENARRSMEVVGIALDSRSVTDDYTQGAIVTHRRLREVADDTLEASWAEVILVRFDEDADVAAATAALDRRYPWGIVDESAPAVPPSLQNIDDVRTVPILLVVFFGGLLVLALGNGLVIAGRWHRRQFGVVRSLGFTRGQVRATLASMALTLGSVSLAFGVPIGLGLGLWLWSALSRQLDVATVVAWPAWFVIGLVPVVLVLAVLAAAWPARAATSETAASVLRSE